MQKKKIVQVSGLKACEAAAFRFLAAVLVIISLLTATASADVVSGDTSLKIEVSEIAPNPARPGEDLLITVNIENTGNEPAENVKVGIEELEPFIFKYSTSGVYGSGTSTEKYFLIEQIQTRSKVELDFHFRVDSRASTGVYQFEFTIEDGNGVSFSRRIPIRVEGNPDIVLTGTGIFPADDEEYSADALVPGQEFYLRTTVKNSGNGGAKNIRVMLDLNDSSPVISLEDNVIFIEKLETGSSENISFKLLLGSNAEVQPYKIPLRITASNEAGTLQIDKSQNIGFNVLNQAEVNVASLKFEPEMPVKGEKVSMILKLENVGEGEGRFVKARLEGLDGKGTKDAFIGRLEKDDDTPAVFTFISENAGEQQVTLIVEYEDDFGEHQLTENLSFTVFNGSGSKVPFVFGVLIVLAAAIFFMKKKKII
ncbi:MAG: COG1361 S-layer family protein [Methanosarcinaceae archaeon]|nr:COG1361 S-layer family protein [Methanosarcinaceae archaeon]